MSSGTRLGDAGVSPRVPLGRPGFGRVPHLPATRSGSRAHLTVPSPLLGLDAVYRRNANAERPPSTIVVGRPWTLLIDYPDG